MKEKAVKRLVSVNVSWKRVILTIGMFIFGLVASGGESFLGTYPFGLSAAAAVSGFTGMAAVSLGAVLGSLRAGGFLSVTTLLLFCVRCGLSLFLVSEKGAVLGRAFHRIREENGTFPPGALLNWAEQHLCRESIMIRMSLAALASLAAGAWAVVDGGYVYYDLVGAILAVMLSPVITYGFYAAHDRYMRYSPFREAGILLLAAVFTYSLSGIGIPFLELNAGQAAGFAAAVLSGCSLGVAKGGLMGLACGILLEPIYAPAYALVGIACGAGSAYSRPLGCAVATAAGAAWGIYTGGYDGLRALAPEFLLMSAILMPLLYYDKLRIPAEWLGQMPDTRRLESATLAETVLKQREKQLSEMADSMQALSHVLDGVAEKLSKPGLREMRDVCEGCFAPYCSGCGKLEVCQEKEYAEFSGMIGEMASHLVRDSGIPAAAIPPKIASRCASIGRILDDVNTTAARYIGEKRTGDKLRTAADDYYLMGALLAESAMLEAEEGTQDKELTDRLSKLLRYHDFHAGSVAVYGGRHKRIFVHDIDLSETRMGGEEIRHLFGEMAGIPLSTPEFSLDGPVLSMRMHSMPLCACEYGQANRAASALTEEAVLPEDKPSGDTVCAFETEGKLYMLISDGMGSGRMAATTSGITALFLERMLSAGAGLEVALRMLNNIIRAGTGECSTTVDLCEVDMVTGEARFVKSGAAPSFVIRGESLFRLQSKTVPIGILRALDAEMIRFTIMPGDTIVMVSDGIARSFEECTWLLDLLSADEDVRTAHPAAAAEKILTTAASHGATDDITAGIIRVTAGE
ncbi:MAG: SpoIIE family protein phosphatase [Clostridia bacterium]|nr:SpoIIE family protein phosphatase [Clostridia bacterium]